MSKKVIRVDSSGEFKGAKLNLTVDISPEDCEIICKEVFEKMPDANKFAMIDEFFQSKNIKVYTVA